MDKTKAIAPTRRQLFYRKFINTFVPVFLATTLLGLISMGLIASYTFASVKKSSANMLQQAKQSIELLFRNVDSVAVSLCMDTKTLDYIGALFEEVDVIDRETVLETERYRTYISHVSHANPDIFSVYVYVDNTKGRFLSSSEYRICELDTFYDSGWYPSFESRRYTHETWYEKRQVPRYSFDKPLEFITVYRSIYPKGMKNNGVVVENIEVRRILSLLETLEFLPGQEFQMLDREGNILLEYSATTNQPTPFFTNKTIRTVIPSERFEWDYVVSVPETVILHSTYGMLQMLLLTVVVVLLISFTFAFFISRKRYKRVVNVLNVLSKNEGHLINAVSNKNDEYDYFIEKSLAEYIERTDLEMQVIDQEYQLSIMQLMALQAQINPHFLFNTLEVIKWEGIALTKGENTVSFMLEDLSDIVRYALSNPSETVSLQKEIEYTQSYLQILKYRYVDKFEVYWEIDENVGTVEVPKLILQPLLENSVYHGVKEKEEFAYIRIKIFRRDSFLHIRITDTGAGMSQEKKEEVRKKLKDTTTPFNDSIGMYNINRRLVILYPTSYTMKIYSKENWGTSIWIALKPTWREIEA